MFEIGEYVVSGKNGVCRVEAVGEPDFLWVEKGRLYYFLQPVYSQGSKVYIPLDHADSMMRPALKRQEADDLIASMRDVEIIPITNEKACEEKYKECLRKNDCIELVRILKTTYSRKEKRNHDGRKITSIDHKYRKIAEDQLYGEIALALNMSKEDVESYIVERMES